MFSGIAQRYDRANTVLSLGIHHLWRRRAVQLAQVTKGSRVLDCATGTGDLAIAFAKAVGEAGVVVGTDFNEDMLALAPQKARDSGMKIQFELADVQNLRYSDSSFDVCSIAFGIRNVDDMDVALREMARVVVPGGRVVVLEFGQPSGVFGMLYRWYGRHVIPTIGKMITGQRAAFEYLPTTAAAFPAGPRFIEVMNRVGAFSSVRMQALTGGVAYVYVGIVQ